MNIFERKPKTNQKVFFGKKGNIQDLITIAIVFFVFSLLVLIGFKVNDAIKEKFEENDITAGNAHINATMAQTNGMFPGVLDNSFLLLVVGLGTMAFVSAALVRIHPIFFVFYVIILTIVIFICGVFSNVYNEVATQAEFEDLADQLTFTRNIMSYLPLIIGIFGTLLAIVMYKLYALQSEQGI